MESVRREMVGMLGWNEGLGLENEGCGQRMKRQMRKQTRRIKGNLERQQESKSLLPITFMPTINFPYLCPIFPIFQNEVFSQPQKSATFQNQTHNIFSHFHSMEVSSQDTSVVISEEMPIIESSDEKSTQNRLSKFLNRVGQNQWISEFDLFSIPLKLNFNGEDTYKTEFGGFIYLLVGICCIVLTIIMQFPDGLVVNSPITYYSIIKEGGKGMGVFDNTNSFIKMYLYNPTTKQKATGDMLRLVLRGGLSIYQVTNSVPTKLQTSIDYTTGDFYFNKSSINSVATVYGTSTSSDIAKLHIEIGLCGTLDTDPVFGTCAANVYSFTPVIEVTNFMETTGGLASKVEKAALGINQNQILNVIRNEYTTNNAYLGYLANIFSYVINFYEVSPTPYTAFGLLKYDTSLGCTSTTLPKGRICSVIELVYSGTTNIVTQNFDDITAPILFFLSLSQTLFYIIYVLMLKNYANNALKLRIADTLVYVSDPSGRHHDFKSGLSVFFACLIHQHALFEAIDKLLYHLFQTHYRRMLPEKMQLTMDMIDYGEKCLDQRQFFGEINEIYSQENVQPSKIIVDFQDEQLDEKGELKALKEEEQQEDEEEPDHYFDDEISQQAFRRMCEQHEFYSAKRKKYLRGLLDQTDKKYKLVLITQDIFEEYKRQLQAENQTKELELPIKFQQNQEISGHELKKPTFY